MNDISDWDSCDIHETAFPRHGYCQECRIESLEKELQQAREEKCCVWKMTNQINDEWTGTCGANGQFNDKGPIGQLIYCPECGGRIRVDDLDAALQEQVNE